MSKLSRPRKPRPDFPLFPHASGRWAKKVRGRFEYFGKVEGDPEGQAAIEEWLYHRDSLLAGRGRRPGDGLEIRDLCNRFLGVKEAEVDTRDISRRHFEDLYTACELIVGHFGRHRLVDDLRPDDFEAFRKELSKTRGAWALGGLIQKTRSIFKYGYEAGLMDKPVRFGPSFKKPGKSAIRRERLENGERMFEAAELRALIDGAGVQLRAMILLGLNCGLGNSDCGQLKFRNVDLMRGWLNYPRPKTGIDRRCAMWPETIAALQEAIDQRPEPKDEIGRDLVFITSQRLPWYQDKGGSSSLGHEFRKLLTKLGLRRKGINFYTLRHVFATIGGGSRDQVAVDTIMGHADHTMAAHYRERIDDSRLKAVAEHVRKWLFPRPRKAK
jgi:integrase